LDLVVIAVVVALSYRYIEAPLRARGRAWLALSEDDPPAATGADEGRVAIGGPPREALTGPN
jgi:peptidoglycan/LPS O-acetylase OafA/YrhL